MPWLQIVAYLVLFSLFPFSFIFLLLSSSPFSIFVFLPHSSLSPVLSSLPSTFCSSFLFLSYFSPFFVFLLFSLSFFLSCFYSSLSPFLLCPCSSFLFLFFYHLSSPLFFIFSFCFLYFYSSVSLYPPSIFIFFSFSISLPFSSSFLSNVFLSSALSIPSQLLFSLFPVLTLITSLYNHYSHTTFISTIITSLSSSSPLISSLSCHHISFQIASLITSLCPHIITHHSHLISSPTRIYRITHYSSSNHPPVLSSSLAPYAHFLTSLPSFHHKHSYLDLIPSHLSLPRSLIPPT